MNTQIPEPPPNQAANETAQKPKPRTKLRTGAKQQQKPVRGKPRAGARKPAVGSRGTKTAKVLHLLQRSGGATLHDLMKATGWQAHSVRGFLSGALRKKMRLALTSMRTEDGERRYSLKG